MERFIEEVRQRWDPDAPEEWDPRGEGYTNEGALALCIYLLAFDNREPERQGQLCEAEERDQVLLHPLMDAFADDSPKPLADPAPQDEVERRVDSLREGLQDQVGRSAAGNAIRIQLPDEFSELMSITNGINGAGVPTETAHTRLVYPIDYHRAEASMLTDISYWAKSRGFMPLAAGQIGCCMQHRHIYYVYCYKQSDKDAARASWRIFDRADVELDIHEDLAQFLQHEMTYVEEHPGGAQQEHIIYQDRYP